jgi:hypothetical protein
MRLDSDETLETIEKLNPTQLQMGINVEASDAAAEIEVRKKEGLNLWGTLLKSRSLALSNRC